MIEVLFTTTSIAFFVLLIILYNNSPKLTDGFIFD